MNVMQLLERSEITTQILIVIHNLQEDNYTKEDASKDLLQALQKQGYIPGGLDS